MDQDQKYARAKVDEPNSHLPESIRKQDIFSGDLSFVKFFAFSLDTSEVKTERKVYRVRNKDLTDVLGKDCKILEDIHELTNTTIALLADPESDILGHKYIDLMGTVDQIKTAEELILDLVLKTYDSNVFPVILMPPTIDGLQITMPLHKVGCVIGTNVSDISQLEMDSGAWIEIDKGSLAMESVINVYGPRENVIKALSLMQSTIRQFSDSSEVDKKLEELFKIPQRGSEKGKQQLQVNIDKYAKVKIVDPNQRLRIALMQPSFDRNSNTIYYKNLFEEDKNKSQHLAEAFAAGAKVDRRMYRIRDAELEKVVGDHCEEIKNIQRVSKCTIGLLLSPDSIVASQSFIDLFGTVDQVETAEKLILDKILKTYPGPSFPIILMPPFVHWHQMKLPLYKIVCLYGENFDRVSAIEIITGAWIEIEKSTLPGHPQLERCVHIHGPKPRAINALSLINSYIYEPGECIDAERELEQLLAEVTYDEIMCGMKPRFKELDPNGSRLQVDAGASGSSSGQAAEE